MLQNNGVTCDLLLRLVMYFFFNYFECDFVDVITLLSEHRITVFSIVTHVEAELTSRLLAD